MPKKTLVLFLLSASLVAALAGCGGGGGGSTPPRTLSTDYYGMEIGAKYSYHMKYTDSIDSSQSDEINLEAVVYSVDTSTPGVSIFKVGDRVIGSSIIEGEYVGKDADNYYSYGTWANDGTDNPVNTGELLMSNPVEREFGARQELVTVPAGTFQKAYVFENETPSGASVQTTNYWFVPYIYGFVKKVEVHTLNGVEQSRTVTELTRVQFGVDTTISRVASLSAMANSISARAILRPYRKH